MLYSKNPHVPKNLWPKNPCRCLKERKLFGASQAASKVWILLSIGPHTQGRDAGQPESQAAPLLAGCLDGSNSVGHLKAETLEQDLHER